MNSIAITSRRLILATFVATDAEDLFACITPAITRFVPWEPPESREAFADVWRSWLRAMEAGTEHYFTIRARMDRRCLGIVGLHDMQSRCPELGIWLQADDHGRGFGKEAIAAVVRWASETLRPDRFEYPVAEQNFASRRIAESLDGSIAGRRRNPKYKPVVYRIPRFAPDR